MCPVSSESSTGRTHRNVKLSAGYATQAANTWRHHKPECQDWQNILVGSTIKGFATEYSLLPIYLPSTAQFQNTCRKSYLPHKSLAAHMPGFHLGAWLKQLEAREVLLQMSKQHAYHVSSFETDLGMYLKWGHRLGVDVCPPTIRGSPVKFALKRVPSKFNACRSVIAVARRIALLAVLESFLWPK